MLDARPPTNRNDTVIKEEDGETTEGKSSRKLNAAGNAIGMKWRGGGNANMSLSLEEQRGIYGEYSDHKDNPHKQNENTTGRVTEEAKAWSKDSPTASKSNLEELNVDAINPEGFDLPNAPSSIEVESKEDSLEVLDEK